MSKPVRTIKPQTPLVEIMENMSWFGEGCLPVMDQQGKIQGIVTVFDIFKALPKEKLEYYYRRQATPIATVVIKPSIKTPNAPDKQYSRKKACF